MNKSKVVDSIEYTVEGAIVKEPEEKDVKKKKKFISLRRRERNILLPSPKIYVNDGSNGTNLVNTYSYKNYCEKGETPSIENNYANNYKTTLISNPVYGAVDGFKLHPTADSGGYSNFTISQYIK